MVLVYEVDVGQMGDKGDSRTRTMGVDEGSKLYRANRGERLLR